MSHYILELRKSNGEVVFEIKVDTLLVNNNAKTVREKLSFILQEGDPFIEAADPHG